MSESVFQFHGTMSERTLRAYLSRAVTALGLCAEGAHENLQFEEDLRFIRNVGAKFVSRAAVFAWTTLRAEDMERHFALAREYAERVHAADPEIILNAFTAEIVRRGCTDGTPIPAWVFEAFGKEPEPRNFRFDDIITLEKGPDFWGKDAGYPDYSREECQMWYYYCNRRYIDCGYECIHMQESADDSEIPQVDKVLTLCREYAKKAARRGLVLFHSFFRRETGGDAIDGRLLFDIHGNGLVPHRTVAEEGAQKCKICNRDESPYTWFGCSRGGRHPLGFEVESNPAIMELDNYGNHPDFAPWGHDDITWFSLQPEWYRNEFLWYAERLLSENYRTSDGKRTYYFMLTLRRCIVPEKLAPRVAYFPGEGFDEAYFRAFCGDREEGIEARRLPDGSYTLSIPKTYHSNTRSDACPTGGNQERTIQAILAQREL